MTTPYVTRSGNNSISQGLLLLEQLLSPTTGCYNRRFAKLGKAKYGTFSCRIAFYSRRYSRQPLNLVATISLRIMRTRRSAVRTIAHEWNIDEGCISVQEVEDFRDAHTWFPQKINLSSGEHHIWVMLLCNALHLQKSKDSRTTVIVSLSTLALNWIILQEVRVRTLAWL